MRVPRAMPRTPATAEYPWKAYSDGSIYSLDGRGCQAPDGSFDGTNVVECGGPAEEARYAAACVNAHPFLVAALNGLLIQVEHHKVGQGKLRKIREARRLLEQLYPGGILL